MFANVLETQLTIHAACCVTEASETLSDLMFEHSSPNIVHKDSPASVTLHVNLNPTVSRSSLGCSETCQIYVKNSKG
jgi:hypothetical protein